MRAPPIRVDGPVEGEEVAGDVVDDRLRLDLDELDAAKLRRVEGASTKLEETVALHGSCSVEHMFEWDKAGMSRLFRDA
jgi:hypothetical protein